MEKTSRFSILIPAYKSAFLSKCIESILAQTDSDLELVILNDQSPEDIDSIVESFKDQRIRYYKNEKNCGAYNIVDNWNKLLKLATGEFAICMGDDDMLAPDCLEELCKLMLRYPNLDVYHSRTAVIDEKGEFTYVLQDRAEYENIFSFVRHRVEGWGMFIGDFCYRISTLRANGGFYKQPLAWGSDDITAYMAIGDKGIVHTAKATFYYRISKYTISSDGNAKLKLRINIDTFNWLRNYLNGRKTITLEDELTRKAILTEFPRALQRWQEFALRKGLVNNRWSIFHFIIHHKKYQLSTKTLITSLYRLRNEQ